MVSDIDNFIKQFDQATKEVMVEVQEQVKDSLVTLFTRIVEDTPVGDLETGQRYQGPDYLPGNLKGNWQLDFGSAAQTSIDRKSPDGGAVFNEIKAAMNAFTLDKSVYFVNNADYAELVEYGFSPKARGGMMRLNVQTFDTILRSGKSK